MAEQSSDSLSSSVRHVILDSNPHPMLVQARILNSYSVQISSPSMTLELLSLMFIIVVSEPFLAYVITYQRMTPVAGSGSPQCSVIILLEFVIARSSFGLPGTESGTN